MQYVEKIVQVPKITKVLIYVPMTLHLGSRSIASTGAKICGRRGHRGAGEHYLRRQASGSGMLNTEHVMIAGMLNNEHAMDCRHA